jgi:hypothetical protein
MLRVLLAVVAPDWLHDRVQPDWLERYGPRESRISLSLWRRQTSTVPPPSGPGWVGAALSDYGRSSKPTSCCLSRRLIHDSGFGNKTTCPRIREELGLPRRIGWRQQDCSIRPTTLMHQPRRNDQPIGLDTKCISPQTCDEDGPRLMTHVATDIGPIPDRAALPAIHAALDQQGLLPEQHLVDAGYVDAELLVASQTEYVVDLVGPTGKDHRGPTREQTGYALRDFSLDWEHKQACCPQGHSSSSWTPTKTRGQEVIPHQVRVHDMWSLGSRDLSVCSRSDAH